jgi:hypothetical protein
MAIVAIVCAVLVVPDAQLRRRVINKLGMYPGRWPQAGEIIRRQVKQTRCDKRVIVAAVRRRISAATTAAVRIRSGLFDSVFGKFQ